MDNLVIRQPCINLETAAVSRLIHLGLVYIHRINAIITAKDNLENNYQSISHFRNAASHRSTYYSTIVKVYNVFSDELKNGGGKIPGDQFTSPPATRQTRIGNSIPQDPPAFASLKTNHSPMRPVLKQVGKCKVQDGVRSRIKNCPEFLVVGKLRKDETTTNIKSDFQNTWCLICQSRTKWFFMICRFYFCMSFKEPGLEKKSFIR